MCCVFLSVFVYVVGSGVVSVCACREGALVEFLLCVYEMLFVYILDMQKRNLGNMNQQQVSKFPFESCRSITLPPVLYIRCTTCYCSPQSLALDCFSPPAVISAPVHLKIFS